MNDSKLNSVLQLVCAVLVIWLINQLADRLKIRVDLTEEKRYTISESTKELLQTLDQEVFFEVYLAGELPPNFERFGKSIREMLIRFSEESGNKVQYKFTDPLRARSARARKQFFQGLIDRGLQPTNLNYVKDGDRTEKLIFPGALVSQGADELPVNLLKGNRAAGPEEILNQSIEGLEYELASSLNRVVHGGTRKIGLIVTHNSFSPEQLAGFKQTVLSRYELYDVNLERKKELVGYDAIIVGKPTRKFNEAEKYLLDQYLIRGGNLLFFLDALRVNMDSASGEGTVAVPYETNLADLLFKYGVRVNTNFVLDINSGQFPVVAGNMGNRPQIQMIPWPFFPLITNFSKHPAVRNLDAILTQFTSTIDTVKAKGIRKTPLLFTTAYTKVLGSPVRVAFNDLRNELIPDRFTDGIQNIGYLLEGKFISLYANRLIPGGFQKEKFRVNGENGKVIVIADGDLIRNELDPETGSPLALGKEPFSKATYANDQFILNLLDYMVDDSGLIETRSREVRIRPLDKVKLKEQRTKWQGINLGVPVLLVLLMGIFKWYRRKRVFAS